MEDVKDEVQDKVEEPTPPVDVTPEETKEETTESGTKDTKDEKPEEPVKEETKEEDKPEEKQESEDVAGLKAEIAKLQGELEQAKANGDSKVELDQVNTLLKVQKDLATEYEGILNGIIEAKLQEIPENLKELVPANLNIKERLDWITKAEKTGIFKQANPDIEIGKPLNPSNKKQSTDTSKLSASSLMAMAYGSSTGRNKK